MAITFSCPIRFIRKQRKIPPRGIANFATAKSKRLKIFIPNSVTPLQLPKDIEQQNAANVVSTASTIAAVFLFSLNRSLRNTVVISSMEMLDVNAAITSSM